MDGVTGMLAWLSHVPVGSRVGLYWPANIDFRFVSELRLQRPTTNEPGRARAALLPCPCPRFPHPILQLYTILFILHTTLACLPPLWPRAPLHTDLRCIKP